MHSVYCTEFSLKGKIPSNYMEMLASSGSQHLRKMFGEKLKSKYPYLGEKNLQLPLEELLKWELWPSFIKIFGTYVFIINAHVHCYYIWLDNNMKEAVLMMMIAVLLVCLLKAS